jgi:hypothetical protein
MPQPKTISFGELVRLGAIGDRYVVQPSGTNFALFDYDQGETVMVFHPSCEGLAHVIAANLNAQDRAYWSTQP